MGLVWLTRSAVAGLAGSGAPLAYLLNLKLANPAQAPAFVAHHRSPLPGKASKARSTP